MLAAPRLNASYIGLVMCCASHLFACFAFKFLVCFMLLAILVFYVSLGFTVLGWGLFLVFVVFWLHGWWS